MRALSRDLLFPPQHDAGGGVRGAEEVSDESRELTALGFLITGVEQKQPPDVSQLHALEDEAVKAWVNGMTYQI